MKGILMTDTNSSELAEDLVIQKKMGPRDVTVRLKAAGVCASDASLLSGKYGLPTPVVMGHEGAGIVEAVGDSVTSCKVGDHVILSTLRNCGHCAVCEEGNPTFCGNPLAMLEQPYTRAGESCYQFAQTSCFAETTIVAENQVISIPKEVPFESAALVGCGVITGVGSVFNRAKVAPGDTCVVIGAGGVGLNVIQACAISGASRIIVFDLAPEKEEISRKFGATDFIVSRDIDMTEAVMELCPGGVNHAFEVVGSNELVRACMEFTAPGGNIVAVGVAPLGSEVSFPLFLIYQNKSLLGCRYGAARPRSDFPMIIDLYLKGKLMLDELVTHTFPLAEYGKAFEALDSGADARSVLIFD